MMILYVYLFVIAATFLSTIGDFSDMAITPRQIYDCTNINMFGCVLIFIFQPYIPMTKARGFTAALW